MAARVLAYIYVGMELAVVPIYQAEITPRRARGFVVGTYQLALAVGGLVVSAIARATGSMQSSAAYLIIYGLFYVVPSIVAAAIWFVPEVSLSKLVSSLPLPSLTPYLNSLPDGSS